MAEAVATSVLDLPPVQKVAPAVDVPISDPKPMLLGAEVAGNALSLLPTDNNTAELTPEDVARVLTTLEARFVEMKEDVFPNLEWSRCKMALESNPKALRSIDRMEQDGHQPAVYNVNKFGFDIGTYTLHVPKSTLGCVNDERAANWLRGKHPEIKFNGSAVQNAAAMGIEIMDPDDYEVLQDQQPFDLGDRIHLFTDPMSAMRNDDAKTNVGWRNNDFDGMGPVHITPGRASDLLGWRGKIRIPWAD